MGKLFRIGEAAVHHHPPECRQASLGEEQSWQMDTGIKPHQATRNQSFRDRRQLRLASVGTAAPRVGHVCPQRPWFIVAQPNSGVTLLDQE
jgi:hypothetical protein